MQAFGDDERLRTWVIQRCIDRINWYAYLRTCRDNSRVMIDEIITQEGLEDTGYDPTWLTTRRMLREARDNARVDIGPAGYGRTRNRNGSGGSDLSVHRVPPKPAS